MEVDTVDSAALEHERHAAPASGGTGVARRLAMLGRPLRGFELRVCDPESGRVLRDREVGELELRGPSVTPGYYRRDDATAVAFRDGWFRTGDLAYLVDGRLVVCGRFKDMIIVGGRNVFPEDIERAAGTVDGVRAGNVIAFGSDRRRGREQIVVVAETRADDDTAPVRDAVATRVRTRWVCRRSTWCSCGRARCRRRRRGSCSGRCVGTATTRTSSSPSDPDRVTGVTGWRA